MRQMQKEKLLPEQTAEKIREYIESNGMKTGDRLPNEFQLAEICGVGRSTVREAIKLLVFSGKVEVIRGSGTYIKKEKAPQEVTMANDDPLGFRENSEENLFQTCLEFVDVRLMLEPEVAAMAATNADYADCQKLQMLQREVGQLVDQGKDHIAADIEYHKQLAACTHNQILCNLMEIVVKGIPLFVKITKNDFSKINGRTASCYYRGYFSRRCPGCQIWHDHSFKQQQEAYFKGSYRTKSHRKFIISHFY